MDKNFLFINFIESLSESGKNMSRASVVWKGENTVIHVYWWLVAMSNFKAFLVPPNHCKFFLQFFNIPIYVTYLYMLLAPNY